MAGNKFNRYLWLINLLYKEGPIPFCEISARWAKSIYNPEPGKKLPLKTFHNHCIVIAEIFGIDVECEHRGDYGYKLAGFAESEQWKDQFLKDLLIANAIKENKHLSSKIMNYDHYESPRLARFVDYISNHQLLSFYRPISRVDPNYIKTEKVFGESQITSYHNFLPLGLIQMEYKWYCIGVFTDNGRLSPFRVDEMKDIEVVGVFSGQQYQDFNTAEYIDYYKFDESDTFRDDRPYLERDIRKHRGRKKYGVAFTSRNMKPLPW